MADGDFDWDDAACDKLWRLWHQADPVLSTTEIARQIHPGLSKNALVGKAHRMGCTHRPSPIHSAGSPRPPRVRLVGAAPTLRPLPSDAPAPASAPAAPPAPPPKPSPPKAGCCWPMWGSDAPRPTHVYCEKPRKPERSYCPEHCKKAYVGHVWRADHPVESTTGKPQEASV